jgi:hypothetical protein
MVIGIAAVLMSIVEMKPWSKAIWILLIFGLALIESKSIEKDRKQAKADQDFAFLIAQRTADNVAQARSDSAQTLATVNSFRQQLYDLQSQKQVAAKHHDGNAVAQIDAETVAVKKKLLLALAPSLIADMQTWVSKWHTDYELADWNIGSARTAAETQRLIAVRTEVNTKYGQQVIPIVTNANSFREQLLEGTQLDQDDRAFEGLFAKAIAQGPQDWSGMWGLTLYTEKLVKKLTPAAQSTPH